MSHLTDGQLHAFMDGAVEALEDATIEEARSHLAACADCAARLEAERLVRDEAASLLGAASPPAFSAPPFEEVERRAATAGPAGGGAAEGTGGHGEPSRRRLFRQPGSLAWAASLAVALTAGWLARSTVGTQVGEMARESRPAESVALQPADEYRDVDQPVAEPESQEASGLPETESRTEAEEPLAEAADEITRQVGADRERAVAAPEAAPEVAPEDEGRLEELANERSEVAVARKAAARPEGAMGPPAGFGATGGPEGWQPMRRDEAEAILGGSLRAVEDLPVLSVYARASEGAPEVWTAQQLPSGHTLHLWQTPLAGDPDGELKAGDARELDLNETVRADQAPAATGRTQQQAYYESLELLQVDGFLIEARAPLSPDSLRALISRLKD